MTLKPAEPRQQLFFDNVNPATRLLEKRRQMPGDLEVVYNIPIVSIVVPFWLTKLMVRIL